LIVKDDTILFEHYRYARTGRDRFLSQSMAKTIMAMLIGIAISENKIRSTDDTVLAYVPSLANTEYGKTSIRDKAAWKTDCRYDAGVSSTAGRGCPIMSAKGHASL